MYPLIMAFTLVYSAEHYVIDILLGWALSVVVVLWLNVARTRRSETVLDSPARQS